MESSTRDGCGNSSRPRVLLALAEALGPVYFAVTIPLRLAFVPDFDLRRPQNHIWLVASDAMVNALLLWKAAILALHSHSAASSSIHPLDEDEVVGEEKNSAKGRLKFVPCNYLPSAICSQAFLLHFVATIPLEYIFLLPGGSAHSASSSELVLNRVLLFIHLPRLVTDIATVLEDGGWVINVGLQRAWKLFFVMALAGHWCGCGFFYVARRRAVGAGDPNTWPEDVGIYRTVSSNNELAELVMLVQTKEAYIQSLYWAYITMITTGFGDIVPLSIPETCWCIFTMYVGVIITTLAIANLQLLVTNMDAAFTNHQRKMELLGRYMRYRKLPQALSSRIMSFYEYQWKQLKGTNENQFLAELPRSLQQKVTNFMCRDLVASIPFLRKGANNALLNALAESAEFHLSIYSPRDDILKTGERIKGAILVSRGEVELLRDGIVERKLQAFDRFSEESLFLSKVCDCNVRAKTFVEAFHLPTHEFQQIVRSQCDESHIAYMKETAMALAKSSVKANKLFGSAEESVALVGFKRHCVPTSFFHRFWSSLQLFGLVFYTFALPLSVVNFFRPEAIFQESRVILYIGYVVDAFFCANLVLTSSYFIFVKDGIAVFDSHQIREEFLRTNLAPLEIVAALPIDILVVVPTLSFCRHFFRMTKILRLPKIFRYVDNVEKIMAGLNIGLGQSAHKVLKLNFVIIVVCHWVACFWLACADFSLLAGAANNWRSADEDDEMLSIDYDDLGGSSYLRSIYWAIVGMSTVGYGDIVATNVYETTFSALVILFGGLFLPAVVGGLAAYISQWNISYKNHRRKLVKVRSYLRSTEKNALLVQRVLRFYDYLWSRQGGINEEEVMENLPGPLRQRVTMHVNGSVLDSVPFFNSFCDDTAKKLIVSVLKPRAFLPSDIIAHQGEVGLEMYFIENGTVRVSSKDGLVPYCILEKGDYFGESCLLGATVRNATVMALSYCDCFVLENDLYREIMSECLPSARQSMATAISASLDRKKRTNGRISHNLTHPKVRRQTIAGSLAEVTDISIPGQRARYMPDANFQSRWNCVILLCSAYNAWCIPFRLAFLPHPSYFCIDWGMDVLMIMDCILHFRDFAFVKDGELITKRDDIKRHYKSTRLKKDLLSNLPYDALASAILYRRARSPNLNLFLSILRLPKLIWLCRIPRILSDLFRLVEDKARVGVAPIRLAEFMFGVILIAHWAACGFFAIARWSNDRSECVSLDAGPEIMTWANEYTECIYKDTWIQRQIMSGKLPTEGGGDLWQLYIRSFNWALPTLVVVVIGDVTPVTNMETLYVFLWILVGVSLNATIIGNVANIVANLETESTDFVESLDAIKSYVHRNHLSPCLKRRVDDFMSYLWSTHGGSINDDAFVRDLPLTLQHDLMKSRQKHIRRCPFFYFMSEDIIRALTLCLCHKIFSPGDLLAHADDLGQEMFFLEQGTVEVLSKDMTTVFATLTRGCFFGETSVFFKQKRNNSIRATSFCEVLQLNKLSLDKELQSRNFDISRMIGAFTDIALSNKMRNEAVAKNLKAVKTEGTKLYRMMNCCDQSMGMRRKVHRAFLPNSILRISWDFASASFATYFAISIPFRIAFQREDPALRSLLFLVMDLAIDFFFALDLYFRCYYFAHTKNGAVMADASKIFSEYRSNGMVLDIISCVPLEIMAAWWGVSKIRLMRLVHFLRVLRLPAYFSRIGCYLTKWNVRVSAASALLARLLFFYVMTNHWCACIWFIIHRYLERDVEYTWATSDCVGTEGSETCLASWDEEIGRHSVCNTPNMAPCYLRSLYFVITTISTVGYGDISPVTELETIWENVVVLIGAVFFAGAIGAFSAYLDIADRAGSNALRRKVQSLKDYMLRRLYTSELEDEVISFHRQKWNQSHVFDEKKIMHILPLPLQMDIAYTVKQDILQNIPLLETYSEVVKKRIAHYLNLQMYQPGSTIYHVGDIGWECYFIAKGIVKIELPEDISVLDECGKQNAARNRQKQDAIGSLYVPGNHFGESVLTSASGVRQETALAQTAVEVFFLEKKGLEEIVKYMVAKERSRFVRNLSSRNGNKWHSFDEEKERDKKGYPILVTERLCKLDNCCQPPTGGIRRCRRRGANAAPSQFDKDARLRSFSVQASREALSGRSDTFIDALCGHSAASNTQMLLRKGVHHRTKDVIDVVENTGESSSSSA